jgi:hypothetical protein
MNSREAIETIHELSLANSDTGESEVEKLSSYFQQFCPIVQGSWQGEWV